MEDCDLSSVFPVAKIKAQLLRDEGVGRLSGKAVRLIGACSAVFLRELAEASDGMEASQTEKAADDTRREPRRRRNSVLSPQVCPCPTRD